MGVDAVENAEVAEIKRAVFRALTRLRAATIKEFDTIARLETQAIDAYNDAHHYRALYLFYASLRQVFLALFEGRSSSRAFCTAPIHVRRMDVDNASRKQEDGPSV